MIRSLRRALITFYVKILAVFDCSRTNVVIFVLFIGHYVSMLIVARAIMLVVIEWVVMFMSIFRDFCRSGSVGGHDVCCDGC